MLRNPAALLLFTALFLLLTLPGCGPIRSTTSLINTQQAAIEASEAGAEEHAPYYWTLAQEYHHKAREEQMDAEYKDAFELGAQAQEYYQQARNVALAAQTMETEEVPTILEEEIREQRRLREEEEEPEPEREEVLNPLEDLEIELDGDQDEEDGQ